MEKKLSYRDNIVQIIDCTSLTEIIKLYNCKVVVHYFLSIKLQSPEFFYVNDLLGRFYTLIKIIIVNNLLYIIDFTLYYSILYHRYEFNSIF